MLDEQLLMESERAAYEMCQRFYEVGSFAGIREFSTYLTQAQENK